MPTGKPINGVHVVRHSRVCHVLMMACLHTGLHSLGGVLTNIDVRVTIIQADVHVTVPIENQPMLHSVTPGPQVWPMPASHCIFPLAVWSRMSFTVLTVSGGRHTNSTTTVTTTFRRCARITVSAVSENIPREAPSVQWLTCALLAGHRVLFHAMDTR